MRVEPQLLDAQFGVRFEQEEECMPSAGSRGWIRTIGSYLPAVFFGSIALVFTVLAMSQSYHFGLSLGVSEEGSLSMARWLSLIDLCTAALPVAAVAMLHRGYRWCAGGLFVVTLVYMAFSMTNQIGFAAAERLARSEKNRAVAAASAKAQSDKSALISRQIGWNNSVSLNRGVMRSSRQESIASTERLIASAGAFDPGQVYAIPEDAQAQALATLAQTTTGFVQTLLVVWSAMLTILAKPIFWALATFFWPRSRYQPEVATGQSEGDSHRSGGPKSSGSRPVDHKALNENPKAGQVAHVARKAGQMTQDTGQLTQAGQSTSSRPGHMPSAPGETGLPPNLSEQGIALNSSSAGATGAKFTKEQVVHLLGQVAHVQPRRSTRSIASETGWARRTLDRLRGRLATIEPAPNGPA